MAAHRASNREHVRGVQSLSKLWFLIICPLVVFPSSFSAGPKAWRQRRSGSPCRLQDGVMVGKYTQSLGAAGPTLSSTAMRVETKLYDVLGVSPEASVAEIKKAYYKAARASHPDLVKDAPDPEAMSQRFQEVADAYQTLADPVRRQSYDLSGLASLAYLKTNATRLFGPPPWRVLLGRTDNYLWDDDRTDFFMTVVAGAIPNGIAGVTMKSIRAAYEEAKAERISVLLERCSEAQAKDTVAELEDFGLAVKAEPIEAERSNEAETPLMYFRRMQRELSEASQSLADAANAVTDDDADDKFKSWINTVETLRSELRAAAKGLEEWKLTQVEGAE